MAKKDEFADFPEFEEDEQIPEALTEWDVDQVLILGDGDYFSGRGIY